MLIEVLKDVHLNVPFGHGCGTDVPAGQKNPGGQGNPVTLSNGEGSLAPSAQINPAAHCPVGVVLPSSKYKLTE